MGSSVGGVAASCAGRRGGAGLPQQPLDHVLALQPSVILNCLVTLLVLSSFFFSFFCPEMK